MKIPWYSASSLLLFLFRTNSRKGHLDGNDFRHSYGLLTKVVFWKLFHHNYVQRFPPQRLWGNWEQYFERYPMIYGYGSTYVLNLSERKQKLMKVPGKRLVAPKSKHVLWRTLHLNRLFDLFYMLLFLSNTVFGFNIVLDGISWITFTTFYLHFCLLIDIWYFTDLEVYPVPQCLFIRTDKLWWCWVFLFWRFSASKCCYFSRKILTW